ncbi:hypothetical protein IGI04_025968 [Brassica rapa subsp. trilocularis]|uniref:Uncharacterized protein n=1 Tax=Brassica rapa subsp. trilocularis TaxID=1813537 RepID=A0ABQ7KYK4_BRACM|nr:hypothetical protein IGI04_025968 [Brassica rapa subsp. trilocularis]
MYFMLKDIPRSLTKFSTRSDMSQTLEVFSEDSWKTLRNSRKTLGKTSNIFYARRLHTKSSRSLPKSYAQSGYKEMMSS